MRNLNFAAFLPTGSIIWDGADDTAGLFPCCPLAGLADLYAITGFKYQRLRHNPTEHNAADVPVSAVTVEAS
jgi:hypothetical protein